LRATRPHDGQAVAAHLAVGLRQWTGREQHALLLQADHVFEMARQMLSDLLGRCPTFRKDDVKLFTKHALGELADALLRHAPLSCLSSGNIAMRASTARFAAAIKHPIRPRWRFPAISAAPAGSSARSARMSAACRDPLRQEARAHRGPR